MPVGDCALRGLSNFEMAVYKGVNLKSMESDPIDFFWGMLGKKCKENKNSE